MSEVRIANSHRQITFEDGYRISEVDSMFGEIPRRLTWIPLKVHSFYYMHICTLL